MTFGTLERRPIVAEFTGGEITSDAGLLLIRQIDQQYGLSRQIAACFSDQRAPSWIEHSLEEMVSLRLYGLAQGYEGLIDHEDLRSDVLLELAVGKLERRRVEGPPLASKSTLTRLEQSYRQDNSGVANRRYVETTVDPRQLEAVPWSLFFAQQLTSPQQLILDIDLTDDSTYGAQEGSGFNGYYQSHCYTPLYRFCGRQLLVARLRPANIHPDAGALAELQRVIPAIQAQWPEVKILVRGDTAYSREEIMTWCEATPNRHVGK
jgi:hypothetical protein